MLKKRISIWIAVGRKYKKCSLLASCTLQLLAARKKIAVLGMLANDRKDHSSPLDVNSLLTDIETVASNPFYIPIVCRKN